MLKINKENTETIYDINLSEEMKKEIVHFWTSSEGETLDYVESLGVVMAEDIKNMIEFLENNEGYNEKDIVPELKEIVTFCEENSIKYIWTKLKEKK